MTHADSCRRHAMRRAWERFGLALAVPDLREIERRIWLGRAVWIADQVLMRQAYRVRHQGRDLFVVFDIRLDAVVTVLPNRAWAIDSSRTILAAE